MSLVLATPITRFDVIVHKRFAFVTMFVTIALFLCYSSHLRVYTLITPGLVVVLVACDTQSALACPVFTITFFPVHDSRNFILMHMITILAPMLLHTVGL